VPTKFKATAITIASAYGYSKILRGVLLHPPARGQGRIRIETQTALTILDDGIEVCVQEKLRQKNPVWDNQYELKSVC
jgi:hypothetical protein